MQSRFGFHHRCSKINLTDNKGVFHFSGADALK
jgi:hypothetical protein